MADFASESQHWYDRDGTPRYEVIAKGTGLPRPTTLSDAKKHGYLPSVTTICKIMASPGLENWKLEQTILASLTLPRIEGESAQALIARIWQDSKAEAEAAADFGTKAHKAIEQAIRGESYDPAFNLVVEGVLEQIEAHFPGGGWKLEHTLPGTMNYGGKVDLHRPGIVLDYKGKEGDLSDVKCYDEHFMQGAAYGVGLFYPEPFQTGNIFFSRTHLGRAKLILHKPREQDRGWRMFQAAFALWKASKDYYPETWHEAAAA